MNIEKLFQAVKDEPMEHTLNTAVCELERQGYEVTVNLIFQIFLLNDNREILFLVKTSQVILF